MKGRPRYGALIRVDRDGGSSEVLQRAPLASRVGEGTVDEATLQGILFDHPECLPIADVDAAYQDPVPVCRELSVPAGNVDALFVNALGRLTLCEFKLWRNPQARREVIGQILDYAKDLASWSYEDLQRQVSLARGEQGANVLYELVSGRDSDIVEAEFVDNVTRHLRRGEFLLLIVGDGIREGVEEIVDFIGRHSGLHFNLALVEAALYADGANHLIVQPRVLARTETWGRFVLDDGVVEAGVSADVENERDPLSDQEEENLRFWTAMLRGFAFADATVEMPKARAWPTVNIKVPNSGYGGWGLSFAAYLYRSHRTVGCYLTCRKDQTREVRIFDEIVASLEELQEEIRPPASSRGDDWTDVELWEGSGRPRLGFRVERDLALLGGSEESTGYRETVAWMSDRLNRLVSGLNPRLQQMLADD